MCLSFFVHGKCQQEIPPVDEFKAEAPVEAPQVDVPPSREEQLLREVTSNTPGILAESSCLPHMFDGSPLINHGWIRYH